MARVVTDLQGFVIVEERIGTDTLAAVGAGATDSSYTQAGARPGTAIPSDERTSIIPRIHAAQDVDMDVRVLVGGAPAGTLDGVSVGYRQDGEADASMRGWNEPTLITYYVPLLAQSGTEWDLCAARTIPSTQKIVAVAWDNTTTHPVSSFTWSPTTRTWGSRVNVESANLSPRDFMVAMAVHPRTERVYALVLEEGENGKVYYTDDAGATWTLLAERVIVDSAGAPVEVFAAADRATMEFDGLGNVLLLLTDDTTGDWWTYVSSDDCTTFLEEADGTALLGPTPNLNRLANGSLLLTYRKDSDDKGYSQVLASAYTAPSSDLDVAIGAGDIEFLEPEIEEVVSCVDHDGIAYALMQLDITGPAGGDKWMVSRSLDNGQSWVVYSRDGFAQYAMAKDEVTDNEVPEPLALAPSGGELVCVFAPHGDMLYSVCLGGWSTLEHGVSYVGRRQERPGSGTAILSPTSHAFVPGAILDDQGWTHTGAAATLLDGYFRYNPAAAQSYDTLSPGPILLSSNDDEQCLAYFYEVRVVSGSTADDRSCVRLRVSDEVDDDKHVSIRHGTAGYIVRDVHAGTTLATVTVDLTAVKQIAVLVSAEPTANLVVLHKAPSSSIWTLGFEGTLSDTGGVGPSAFDVGTITASSPDVRFGAQRYSVEGVWSRDLTDSATIAASPIPHGLKYGKSLSSAPYPIRDRGDSTRMARISLAGGAGRVGETFDVPAIFDYGVDKCLPMVSPSPRSGWRTTQTASDEALVFDIGADTHFDYSRTYAIFFAGLHTPQNIVLERRAAAAGAWTTVGTYNGATGFESLEFLRNGDVVVGDTGTTVSSRYSWGNEWVGGYAILDTGGTPVARTILSNTPGYWTAASGVPRMEVRLGGITGSEVASGSLSLVHPSGVMIVPGGSSTYFRRLRVRIPGAQVVPDAYYHIGSMAVGGVLVPGHKMDRGWTMRYAGRNRTTEDDYGTVFSKKRGPTRRELTWAYSDGNSLYGIRNASEPDIIQLHSSGHIEASYGDVTQRLVEMLTGAKGGAVPVVALLKMPTTSSVVTITDPTLFIYGRLSGTVQSANVVGSPGAGELERVESLNLVEFPWDRD
jgi:hypothetical protein